MKTSRCRSTLSVLSAVALLFRFGSHDRVFGQGSLTPPGSPAPTMKSLDQVEARTLIASLPYTISASGSYYLTQNLTATGSGAGITVSADNVTIDLNGFALVGGGSGTVAGISVPAAQKNLCVRRGTVSSWTAGGISANNATGSLFESLRIVNNRGTGIGGIYVGNGSTIRACVATSNSSSGMAAIRAANNCTVVDCTASSNYIGIGAGNACTIIDSTASSNTVGMETGDDCTILHCTASTNISGGIYPGQNCIIGHCTMSGNGTYAIFTNSDGNAVEDCVLTSNEYAMQLGAGNKVRGCTVRFNVYTAVQVSGNSYIADNIFDGNNTSGQNNYAGLYISGGGNRVESNNFSNNKFAGLIASGGGNIIIRNTFAGTAYIAPTSNTTGPFVVMTSGGTISANPGDGGTSPWANFYYQ